MRSKWIWALLAVLFGVAVYAGAVLATPQTNVTTSTVAKSLFDEIDLNAHTIPANIWLDFMKVVTENMEVQDFPARAGVGDDKIPTPTSTPTTTFTPPPATTTEAPTTTRPTKTNGTGKPQPTTTTRPTFTVPLPGPSPTSTKPGNGQ